VVLSEGKILADGTPTETLTTDVLARAYGIEARVRSGEHGSLIEIVGRTR
jgi:iron complex transport system ATP-binding protein